MRQNPAPAGRASLMILRTGEVSADARSHLGRLASETHGLTLSQMTTLSAGVDIAMTALRKRRQNSSGRE